MNNFETLIKYLDQQIQRVKSNLDNIIDIISEAGLKIDGFKLQLKQTDKIKEFWQMYVKLNDWIDQGTKIIQEMFEFNIIKEQRQQIFDLSSHKSNYFEDKEKLMTEFIKSLEFLSGGQILDINYVNPPESYAAFKKEYGTQKIDLEKQFSNIIGYQRVRGDGNCFYTSFLYQYLNLLLSNSQNRKIEINKFINKVDQLELTLFLNDQSLIKMKIEIEIKKYFNQILKQLQQNPSYLLEYFSKNNKQFYVCSIIIFRNIVRQIYNQKKSQIQNFLDTDLEEELVTWQKECNSNQAIIQLLSQELDLQVNLYFFRRDGVDLEKYNQNQNLPQINLLFRPGHYQIALCQNSYQESNQKQFEKYY
ncbi:unnamed protein product [Paramecium octaurelia]|uniref:OTU domain-containing protein n=1 Tax=Paramecium octaurelia TaxID=43137 RepID=A0A8S1TP30_PAROT|nr:unnamed protein product [Paramecium octaurelia]